MMFDYTIYPDNSPERFLDTCQMIETELKQVKKQEILIDVDGSTYQEYTYNAEKITVFDDYEVGAVYIVSSMNLDFLFKDDRTK